MKKRIALACVIFELTALVNISANVLPARAAQDTKSPQIAITATERNLPAYVPGEVIVKFKDNANEQDKQAALQTLAAEGLEAQTVQPKGKSSIQQVQHENRPTTFSTHSKQTRKDAKQLADELSSNPAVEYAEPNYLSYISLTPHEEYLAFQWGPNVIHASTAWDSETGDPGVVIGVIDTGVDLDHEDLQDNLVPGQDFVDIDTAAYLAETYTDDSPVYELLPGEDYTTIDDTPDDYNGHGTHVAGIANAVTDNYTGIAGTCWDCKTMPVRAGFSIHVNDDPDTPGNEAGNYGMLENDDSAAAIIYAADHGADVLNLRACS